MTLVEEMQDNGTHRIKLIECPLCDHNLRGRHASSHIAEHAPEEFGLTPVGGAV